jgi:hypothetical protein
VTSILTPLFVRLCPKAYFATSWPVMGEIVADAVTRGADVPLLQPHSQSHHFVAEHRQE